jgi:RNA polymerase sigma-70 factor (ECF subfamily)
LLHGKPAFALYVCDPSVGHFHSMGLLVVSLAGQRISAITRLDNSVLPHFGLPRELSA